MTGPVIVVDGLRMRYRGATTDAVDGISFTVAEGEIFGFLGREVEINGVDRVEGGLPWDPQQLCRAGERATRTHLGEQGGCGAAQQARFHPGGAVGEELLMPFGQQVLGNVLDTEVDRLRRGHQDSGPGTGSSDHVHGPDLEAECGLQPA